MPIRTIRYTTLVSLCLFPLFESAAQGQDKLSGLFQVVIKSKNPKSIPDQKTILAIDQLDDKLFAVDLRRPTTLLMGARRGKNVELPIDLVNAEGKTIRLTMTGTFVEKKFGGSISDKDKAVDASCKSTAANSGWYCGNHDPAHVAFTTDEVAECTRKHGCKGWRQLSASDVSDFVKSKMDKKK